MIDNSRLEWLKGKLEHADYVRMGQWGEAGEDIEDEVLDLIEEVERLRKENSNLMGLHIAHMPRDEHRISQTVTVSACPECERLTKEMEPLRQTIRDREAAELASAAEADELRAEVARLTARCEVARKHISILKGCVSRIRSIDMPNGFEMLGVAEWLESKP